jgi:FtsZ-binding cell division protein ZapB
MAVSELTNINSQLTREVSELTKIISQLTRKVSELTKIISQLTREVSELTKIISQLTREVSELTKIISQLMRERGTSFLCSFGMELVFGRLPSFGVSRTWATAAWSKKMGTYRAATR